MNSGSLLTTRFRRRLLSPLCRYRLLKSGFAGTISKFPGFRETGPWCPLFPLHNLSTAYLAWGIAYRRKQKKPPQRKENEESNLAYVRLTLLSAKIFGR